MPRVRGGQNVGLRYFCHILTLLPLGGGASIFHKHMSSYNFSLNYFLGLLTETDLAGYAVVYFISETSLGVR